MASCDRVRGRWVRKDEEARMKRVGRELRENGIECQFSITRISLRNSPTNFSAEDSAPKLNPNERDEARLEKIRLSSSVMNTTTQRGQLPTA